MDSQDDSRDTVKDQLMGMSMSSAVDTNTVKAFQSYSGGLVGTSNLFYKEYIPYTPYVASFQSRDSFADAFKVVSMLVEQGYLKNINLSQFIKIVKAVEGEL